MSILSISLKRANKVYQEGDIIVGVVTVDSGTDVRHEGLILTMEGFVNLQPYNKNTGIFDALSNSIKPINLVSVSLELVGAGKIPSGHTEIPFEIPLIGRGVLPGCPALLETYHGVFINVIYTLKCQMKRSFLNKPLNTTCQFFVQYKKIPAVLAREARVQMCPSSSSKRRSSPHFLIFLHLHNTICALDQPITGTLRVDECSVRISSIELQLVRVETCGTEGDSVRDATEIQNIQMCNGDPPLGRELFLHMTLPRLFVCPTTAAHCFKIEFELNVAVIFEDEHLVTENFPILLVRSET